mgnify:FL=1
MDSPTIIDRKIKALSGRLLAEHLTDKEKSKLLSEFYCLQDQRRQRLILPPLRRRSELGRTRRH